MGEQVPKRAVTGRSEVIEVASYAVDTSGRLTPAFLLRMFQEAAYHNAEELEFGFSDLGAHGLFWVLSRLRIEFARMPRWSERIVIETWPKGVSRLFALRDFRVTDVNGAELVSATTAWLVLDAETRRVRRPETLFQGTDLPTDRHAIVEEPAKLPPPDCGDFQGIGEVRYGDLDVNGHVNNARYVEWVFDRYTRTRRETGAVRALEVNFLTEAFMGDHVSIRGGCCPDGTDRFDLVRESDGKELCRLGISWER